MKKTANVKYSIRGNLIWQGWRALHVSALKFGSEVDDFTFEKPEMNDRSYLDGEVYTDLVFPLVGYCGIDIDKFNSRSELVGSLIWRRLRTKAIKEEIGVWLSISDERTPLMFMKNFDEANLIKKRLLDKNGYPNELKAIANVAFTLIRQESSERICLSRVLYGLGLIGAIQLLWKQRDCDCCFRRAWPGKKYCIEHSQSQASKENRSALFQAYRKGIKAKELATQRGLTHLFRGSAMERSINRQVALGDMLFHSRLFVEKKEIRKSQNSTLDVSVPEWWEIQNAQSEDGEGAVLVEILKFKCPLTLKLLGGDVVLSYSYRKIINTLRDKIDPYEWMDQSWGGKLLLCELWLQLEAEVTPGERGLGKKSQLRIEKAMKLASTGMSKVQIASTLGVSPSTISKWLDRKPELRGKI